MSSDFYVLMLQVCYCAYFDCIKRMVVRTKKKLNVLPKKKTKCTFLHVHLRFCRHDYMLWVHVPCNINFGLWLRKTEILIQNLCSQLSTTPNKKQIFSCDETLIVIRLCSCVYSHGSNRWGSWTKLFFISILFFFSPTQGQR